MRHATSPRRLIATAFLALLALSLLSACKDPATPSDSLPSAAQLRSTVFIARTAEPSGYMEALFSGVITVDPAGCLRMEGLERHSPIWPKGYELEVTNGSAVVRRGDGSIVGTIGGEFVLGGGEVHTLGQVALSLRDRQRATSSCPGQYWIVSGP